MSNLVTINSKGLIGPDEMKVMRESLFTGFNEAEINYCFAVVKALNLNPLLKQIHFVKRGNRIVTQTGIDGFRLTAERTGMYAGSDEAVFEYSDGDAAKKKPIKAMVTVYKMVQGQRCAFAASARWDEYCPSAPSDAMWKKMPHGQLSKCAEALALRKAFPAELSSVYSEDEMHQADNHENKAQRLNAQVVIPQPATNESNGEVTDDAFEEAPQEHFCDACENTKLLFSEKKQSWYCPNWQDRTKRHSSVRIVQ